MRYPQREPAIFDHFGITVGDVSRSDAFYQAALAAGGAETGRRACGRSTTPGRDA